MDQLKAMAQAAQPPRLLKLVLRPVLGLVAFALVAYLLGVGFGPLNGFMDRWAVLLLEFGGAAVCALRAILVREERRAWTFLSIAVFCWALGDEIWRLAYFSAANPPDFTAADALWIAFYPFAYAGIALLIRDRTRRVSAAIWLDGLIAVLAVAALASAVILSAVFDPIGGSSPASAVNLAYVLGDSILLALILVAFALSGWQFDRAWAWLGSALAIFALSDGFYLYQAAQGTYVAGGLLDAGWGVALLLVGIAAWHTGPPRKATSRPESWRSIALPIAFGFGALAIEVYDHFTQVTVPALAFATACLAAVLARLAMTFGQYLRMLRASRKQATTDALTSLGNRRQLMLDLDEALPLSDPSKPLLLVLLDLDCFKAYNDTLGHPAGDALLERVGHNLEQRLRPWGRAYRIGGDEFCALLQLDHQTPAQLSARAAEALSEPGAIVPIHSSAGWALLPIEAAEPSEALRLADQRMYADKDGHRRADRRGGIRALHTERRAHA